LPHPLGVPLKSRLNLLKSSSSERSNTSNAFYRMKEYLNKYLSSYIS